jgi:hypothetical protein
MSVSDDVSYFSRFLVKFAEIIAAGLATAVSGYLIAHLTGALSTPTPTPVGSVIQVAPSASMVFRSLPAQPIPPNSTDTNEQRFAPQQEVNTPPVAQPARRTVNTTKAALPPKHMDTGTSAAESKRDQESLVARVRAALASVDANRKDPLDVLRHRGDVRREPVAVTSQPRPVVDPSGVAADTAAPPGAAELRPAPAQQAPIEPNPLTAVEIKSWPIAAAQSSPTPPAAEETGVLSTLEQILRHDPLAATDDAPRPPMPIGE